MVYPILSVSETGPPSIGFEDIDMSANQSSHISTIGLRIVLVASLILLLLATLSETNRLPATVEPTPALTESSTPDTLIVPGTRIGPVTLGLPTRRLEQVLGKATLRPQGQGTIHLYPDRGLVVYVQDGRVFSVTCRSPLFKTRSGVGVEADVDEVLRTLSKNYEMEGSGSKYLLHNWSEGWHIEVKDNKVSYLQITPKLTEGQK